MARNTSIALGNHFESFVDEQVNGGNYTSVSEVIRAGLRLLEEHQVRVEHLRNEIQKGLNSEVITSQEHKERFAAKRRQYLKEQGIAES